MNSELIPAHFKNSERDILERLLQQFRNRNPEQFERLLQLRADGEAVNDIEQTRVEQAAKWAQSTEWLNSKIRESLEDQRDAAATVFLVVNFDNVVATRIHSESNTRKVVISPFVYTMK